MSWLPVDTSEASSSKQANLTSTADRAPRQNNDKNRPAKLKTTCRGGGHRCRPILVEDRSPLQSTLQPTTVAKHPYRTKKAGVSGSKDPRTI